MYCVCFFFSSRRRHTRCALVTGVQTCALPIFLEEMVKEPKLRPEMLVLSSSRSVYGEGAYIAASDEGSEGASRHYPASRSATDMHQGVFEFSKDGAPLTPVPTTEPATIAPGSVYPASKYHQKHKDTDSDATSGHSLHP